MPKNLTPELVQLFYKEALTTWDAKQADKGDSAFMQIVADLLDGLGITNHEVFLNHFTTTLGSTIYTPFKIGVPSENYDLGNQFFILPHELTHVTQYHHRPTVFPTLYLTNKSFRANSECQAYGVSLELHWWDNNECFDIPARAKTLFSYGLQQEHVGYMVQYLEVLNDVFAQGGEVDEHAIWTKRWLEAHNIIPNYK